jgi:hypothetical protein
MALAGGPISFEELLQRAALGGMSANPGGLNTEALRANAPMPNPNMGGGFLGALRRGATGLQNGLGRVGQGLFPMDPGAAQHMSAEQMQGLRGQGIMDLGMGLLAHGSQPGASLGGALAKSYFGAQEGAMGRQQMAYQLGAANREEKRDDERYQTTLGRQARLDDLAERKEGFDQFHADRTFDAGRDDETWMRGYREKELASLDEYRDRNRLSALEQAEPLSGDAIDLIAHATLRRPELMNNYLSRSGMGNQKNRNLVTERQAAILKAAGSSPDRVASIQANVKAHTQALSQNQKAVSSLQAFEAVVRNNGQRLNELLERIPDTGVPLGNALARGAKYNLGDADVAEFRQVLQNFQAETARIVAGHPQLLGNVTDSARKEIESVVSGNMTVAQTKRVIQRLMFESQVREEGFKESLAESGRAIQGLGFPGQSFPGGFQEQPGPVQQPGGGGGKVIRWEDME